MLVPKAGFDFPRFRNYYPNAEFTAFHFKYQ